MRMKTKGIRLLSIALIALLAFGMLTACDKGENGKETETTEVPTEAPTEAPTEPETTLADLAPADVLDQIQNPDATLDPNRNLAVDVALSMNMNMNMVGASFTVNVPVTVQVITADGAISLVMSMEVMGEAMNTAYYWKDGVFYIDDGMGSTLKTSVSWTDVQALFEENNTNSMDMSTAELFISLSSEATGDDGVVVICKGINPTAYEKLVADPAFSEMLEKIGLLTPAYDDEGNPVAVPSEELMEILEQFTEENYVVTYTVDAEGTVKAVSLEIKADLSVEDEDIGTYTSSYHITMSCTYTYGGQTVTIPADAASWEEVNWDDYFGTGDVDIDW